MDKGVDVANAKRTIDMLRKSGLFCFVNAMIGFPGETEAEMLETIRFLKDNVGDGIQASLSVFTLNHGSYVYNHPDESGVTWIEDAKDFVFKDCYLYTCEGQVPYEVVLDIFETF
jgi:radical SAM superfamily enzyme